MEIKGLGMQDQLRMMRGVESILPKKSQEIGPSVPGGEKTSFLDFLQQQVAETNRLGVESDHMIERSLAGEEVNPHETVIALQQADISFRLLLTVKERLIQAYDTLMRTQIG